MTPRRSVAIKSARRTDPRMNRLHVAPTVGILAAVGYLLALAVPYATDPSGAVGAYYAAGPVSPLLAGLLALVSVLVFAAARQGRTEPDFAAGVALVFGLFVVGLTLGWALAARVDAVTVWQHHRWLVLGLGLGIPISATWYARVLGVL
jgi:hypothetical protein